MIWNYVILSSFHKYNYWKIYLKGEIYNPGHNNNCWNASMFFNVYVDKLMRSKQTCQTNIEGKSGETCVCCS